MPPDASQSMTRPVPRPTARGYVEMPNVNVVEEMVNLISASRAYQNNAEMMNTARTLLQRTLQIVNKEQGTIMATITNSSTSSTAEIYASLARAAESSDSNATNEAQTNFLTLRPPSSEPGSTQSAGQRAGPARADQHGRQASNDSTRHSPR